MLVVSRSFAITKLNTLSVSFSTVTMVVVVVGSLRIECCSLDKVHDARTESQGTNASRVWLY
jgi:hypothetical protein